MFPEASTFEIHLSRQVADRMVPAPLGEWSARDAAGQIRHFSWRERVRDPILRSVGVRVFASYGVSAQLARLKEALDDVAAHTPEDAETSCLQADVMVWKNGRAPSEVVLQSAPRAAAASSVGERD
jgi:hypothetical protein